jgi:hypothetical protein
MAGPWRDVPLDEVLDPLDELVLGGAEPDWSLLAAVARIILALVERLQREPELSRDAALQFVKQTAPVSIHFRSLIWPQARVLAGLPIHARRGRPGRHFPRGNYLDVLFPRRLERA